MNCFYKVSGDEVRVGVTRRVVRVEEEKADDRVEGIVTADVDRVKVAVRVHAKKASLA